MPKCRLYKARSDPEAERYCFGVELSPLLTCLAGTGHALMVPVTMRKSNLVGGMWSWILELRNCE